MLYIIMYLKYICHAIYRYCVLARKDIHIPHIKIWGIFYCLEKTGGRLLLKYKEEEE